ncbi:Protein fmp32, mitochondrial [Dimargaris xerosporica]|nr:Protein fmp32, mitochondrial [Dimargaris xerosporica]
MALVRHLGSLRPIIRLRRSSALSAIPKTYRTISTGRPCHAPSEHHFDTLKLTQRLEQEGFSSQQSETVMRCLQDVVGESIANFKKDMVTKADQEKNVYMYKVDFAQLKSEIQMLEKNDYTVMKSEISKLMGEVEKLRQKLKEEITRCQAGVRLDMNLEKGRIRDESGTQMLKVKETNTKIEAEIANLRTQMETIKFQILQYMIGTITGSAALILAYLRMFR